MAFIKATSMVIAVLTVNSSIILCNGHGYLMTPKSRNYFASTDGMYYCNPSVDDCDSVPTVEDCPHCMNRADNSALCGVKQNDPTRNYDTPKNYNGGPMPWIPQATYAVAGQEIDIDFVLTAHHKGHVSMYACPVSSTGVPTQACFDQNPLAFEWDYKYGAVKDVNYPERFYIAPPDVQGGLESRQGGVYYQARMKLPAGVSGQVLLQWRYYTANSCIYSGYDAYPWPAHWGGSGPNLGGLGVCPSPLPSFTSAPERFWNCAEVMIGGVPPPPPTPSPTVSTGAVPTRAPSTPTGLPTRVPTRAPTRAPTPAAPSLPAGPTPAIPVPTAPPAPSSSPAGTGGACCRNGVNGLKAANGCLGFVSCVNGTNHGYIACPPGLVFNEAGSNGYCDYASNVPNCVSHCAASVAIRGRKMLRSVAAGSDAAGAGASADADAAGAGADVDPKGGNGAM